MSETYCGLLNVLILALLAAANGLQLRRLSALTGGRRAEDSGSDEHL